MNWFQRHLNWSLFFADILLPITVGVIFVVVYLSLIGGFIATAIASGEQSPEFIRTLFSTFLPIALVSLIVALGLTIFEIVATLWYLGRKGRSKGYIMLIIGPGIVSFILAVFNAREVGEILGGLGSIAGLIILFLLENHTIGYDADFINELQADRWQDTGSYSAPDDRQLKELDYTPAKNVLDIVGSGDVKDAKDVGDVSAAGVAGEAAPAEEKVVEKIVSQERLKMPILMDDAGAVIRCFYHPGADAVNLCSRCKQYVCNECNYVTGTHPICRNCWEKRAEVPIIAVPAKKPESPASGKPEKQKSVEAGKPEKQKIAAPGKAEKPEAKKNEWLPEFMALYEQAAPIINVIVRKSADGMPASPLDLMEGLKLRPMLERAKKLSKPKEKELREAKNEFEQVLSSCIKIADAAADFVSGGGQALLGGPDFTRIVHGIETANGLIEKLSRRLASFPHLQE